MTVSLRTPPLLQRLERFGALMAIYFAFELQALAARSLYLHLLEGTETIFEVGDRIRAFRNTVVPRPRTAIPH